MSKYNEKTDLIGQIKNATDNKSCNGNLLRYQASVSFVVPKLLRKLGNEIKR